MKGNMEPRRVITPPTEVPIVVSSERPPGANQRFLGLGFPRRGKSIGNFVGEIKRLIGCQTYFDDEN